MAFDLSHIQRKTSADRAPLIVVHGQPGVGKTTFAAGADSPVFVQTEDGLIGLPGVDAFPVTQSYDDVISALEALYEDADHNTIVIDSLSSLEPLIWARVAQDNEKKSIEDIGYSKGYIFAMTYWREVIKACQGLTKLGKTVILIAHTEINKVDPPDGEAYDRYEIKLHKRALAHVIEQADIIGFAHEPIYVCKEDEKDKSGKAKAKGGRLLRLTPAPAISAKVRFPGLPDTVSLDWAALADAIAPFFSPTNHTTNQE